MKGDQKQVPGAVSTLYLSSCGPRTEGRTFPTHHTHASVCSLYRPQSSLIFSMGEECCPPGPCPRIRKGLSGKWETSSLHPSLMCPQSLLGASGHPGSKRRNLEAAPCPMLSTAWCPGKPLKAGCPQLRAGPPHSLGLKVKPCPSHLTPRRPHMCSWPDLPMPGCLAHPPPLGSLSS